MIKTKENKNKNAEVKTRATKKKAILTRAQKIADAINSMVCAEYMLTIAQQAMDGEAIGFWIDAKHEATDRLICLGILMGWRKDTRQNSIIDISVNNDQSKPLLGTIHAKGQKLAG